MREIIKLKQEIECLRMANKNFFEKFYKFYIDQIYNAFDAGEDIGFQTLEQVRIGDTLLMKSPDGKKEIASKRVNGGCPSALEFFVKFDAGALLKRHRHGDCDESVIVEEGGPFLVQLTNKHSGEIKEHTLHEKGATLMVSKDTEHQFTNLGETEGFLTVKFLKI